MLRTLMILSILMILIMSGCSTTKLAPSLAEAIPAPSLPELITESLPKAIEKAHDVCKVVDAVAPLVEKKPEKIVPTTHYVKVAGATFSGFFLFQLLKILILWLRKRKKGAKA